MELVTQEQATQIHKDVQRIVREVAEEGAREAAYRWMSSGVMPGVRLWPARSRVT